MLFKLGCAAAALGFVVLIAAGTPYPQARAQGLPPLPSLAAGAQPAAARTGDVVVRFRGGTTLGGIAGAAIRANSAIQDSTAGSGLVLLHPASSESVDAAVARLRSEPDIEFAEPNTTVHVTTTTPNDPYFASYGSNLTAIGVPTAWDKTKGSASVTVAVLDTGVDATHEDLAGGRVVAGFNFIANNTNTADDFSHGTFVAGIIGATGNNAKGVAGVCWTCKIMPVKVLDANGNGDMFHAAQGIDWAVAHGANVINMSFGGGVGDAGMQTAVNNAWNAGVVLVAAAGNDNHGPVLYPAAFSNVVAVGSLNTSGSLSTFSNVGPQVDLVAPGESIASTLCTCHGYLGGYGVGGGTSFASPEVAGVAALMIASGITNNATIVSTLKATADDLETAGFDNDTGFGRVDAAAALGDTTPPTVSITSPANGATVSGTVNITATAGDNVGVQKVRFWVDSTYLSFDLDAPYAKTWDTTGSANGPHTVKVEALDAAGNSSGLKTMNVSVSNIDVTLPDASITSPADASTVSGTVNIAASASDNVGVQKVRFWVDSTYLSFDLDAPYAKTWDTTGFANGPHAVKVEALDAAGNSSGVKTINVSVNNIDATPPLVSITSPADGSTASGITSITATASDDVGVQKVRFWVDNTYLSFDLDAPYAKTWDTTGFANGPHAVKVEALDPSGNSSGVQTITVNVNNG